MAVPAVAGISPYDWLDQSAVRLANVCADSERAGLIKPHNLDRRVEDVSAAIVDDKLRPIVAGFALHRVWVGFG